MKKRFTLLKKPIKRAIKKSAYGLVILTFCLFSFSCSEKSKIDYRNTSSKLNNSNSAASKAIASQVLIENNQLIIRGRDLEGVKTITVKNDEGLNETFEIESISNSEIIANGVRNFSLIAGKLFSLVLADAYGSASFNISIDLEDGSVTASKLSDMGAADGDVLVYDQGGQKWDPRPLSGLNLVGTWNANTNDPILSSGGASTSPLKGDYYVVAVSGTTSIDGESSWSEGDWVIYNGTTWDRIVNSSSITSFNSRQGAVVPEAGDYDLADLGDVDLTGLAADKVLKYDGAKWVVGDDEVSTGGGTGTGETDTVILNADSDGNSSGEIQFKVNNNTKAVIDNNGNFALGSGTANAKLDVFANSGPLAVFDMLDNTANNFVLKQGSDEYLNVDTSDGAETLTFGNATTNPVFKFLGTRMDVDGDILLTSGKDICIDGANCLSDSGDLKADGSVAMSGDLDLGNQKIINASGAQIKGAIEEALSGTVTVDSGTDAVVGASTLFTTELSVGDIIDIGGETFSVSAIADDTNLTLSANHSTGASGAAIAKAGSILSVKGGDDSDFVSVTGDGKVGIGTDAPRAQLHVAGGIRSGGTTSMRGALDIVDDAAHFRDNGGSNFLLVTPVGTRGAAGPELRFYKWGHSDQRFYFDENATAQLNLTGTLKTEGNLLTDGSLGVGVLSPTEKLDVDGNVKATAFIGDGSQLTGITADSSENTADAVLAADSDSAGGGDILFNTAGTTKASISNEGDMTLGAAINSGTGVTSFSVGSTTEPSVISLGEDSDNNAALTWNNTDNYVSIGTRSGATDYTDTLVVKDGKVGVGTASPNFQFHLQGTQGTLFNERNTDDEYGAHFSSAKSRGNSSSKTIVLEDDELGSWTTFGFNGDVLSPAARIISFVDGEPGDNDMPGRLVFQTTPDGSENLATRMVINNVGDVGIGTTSPSKKLHVNSGAFDHSLLLESSDARVALSLKDNASSADNAVAIGAEGDSLFFRSGDADRMLLDASGNVGVGTDSPAQQLHVHRPADNSSYLQFSNTITGQLATDGLLVGLDSDEDAIIRLREDKNLRLWTNDTERMTILNDGNVGIGTTTPTSRLHLRDRGAIAGGETDSIVTVEGRWTGSPNTSKNLTGLTVDLADPSANSTMRGIQVNSSTISTASRLANAFYVDSDGQGGSFSPKIIDLDIDYTSMLSTSRDYYGLKHHVEFGGTATASYNHKIYGLYSKVSIPTQLNSNGEASKSYLYGGKLSVDAHNSDTQVAYSLYLENAGTPHSSHYGLYQEDTAVSNYFGGNVGIGTTSPSKALHVLSTDTEQLYLENPSADGHAQVSFINDSKQWQMGVWGSLDDSFVLRETGAGYRFVVAAGGNVGIGTTTPSEALEVNGNIKADAYLYTSDERFKEDIKTIDSALEGVKKLRGVTYVWRRDEFPERNFEDVMQFGLIAQEVERIYPELVNTSSDGHKSVKYANIVSILIEAIKEQDVRIVDTQERLGKRNREIASLKDKNKDLEKRIQKLEGLVEKLLDK